MASTTGDGHGTRVKDNKSHSMNLTHQQKEDFLSLRPGQQEDVKKEYRKIERERKRVQKGKKDGTIDKNTPLPLRNPVTDLIAKCKRQNEGECPACNNVDC